MFGSGTCVLDAKGVVYCWNFDNRRDLAYPPPPFVVLQASFAIGPVTDVSVGAHELCAIAGDRGECLRIEPSGALGAAVPLPLSGVREVASGDGLGFGHGCALRGDSTVVCWRRTRDMPSEPEFVPVAKLRSPRQLSSGGCAVEADGRVACFTPWLASADAGTATVTATRVASLDGAEEVRGMQRRGCTRHKDGTVRCWGENEHWQGGQANPAPIAIPLLVVGVDHATGLALGGRHSCALRADGVVLCWGDNSFKQIGDSVCTLAEWTELPKTAPSCLRHEAKPVPDLPQAKQVAAGDRHTCIIAVDGEAYCWGAGYTVYETKPVHVNWL
jgi:hypothetical protein